MSRFTTKRVGLALLACGLAVATLLPGGSPAGGQAQPEAGSSDWRMVSTGRYFSCGVRTTGLLYCWGDDDLAQLGNGAATGDQSVPVLGGNGWNDWVSVSAGEGFACGLRATGGLYCWGANQYGQLGNGTTSTFDFPTPVQGANNNWTSITVGGDHACGRYGDGRLFCWGANDDGQLGMGAASHLRPYPRLVAGGFTDWTSVDAGEQGTCARRATGRLYCWGDNAHGELGDGTTTSRPAPRLVAGGITNWRSVDIAGNHTCALRANGRLYCWGYNLTGQLGDGTTTDRRSPHLVPGSAVWTAVVTGGRDAPGVNRFSGMTCARRNTGRLYCWGDNLTAGVGDGTTTERRVPTPVAGGATDWRTVSVGMYHTCAATTDSRAYCWGYNADGELGVADTTFRSRPQAIWAGGSVGTSSGGSSGTTSSGATSSGATSSGATSSGATSSGATSSGATSSGATSSGATSSGATSSGATSSGATSSGATSSGATSSGASTGLGSPAASVGSPTSGMDLVPFLVVALALVGAGTVLIDGRRWQPLDGARDPVL